MRTPASRARSTAASTENNFVYYRACDDFITCSDGQQYEGKLAALGEYCGQFQCRAAIAHTELTGERKQDECLGNHEQCHDQQYSSRDLQQQSDIDGHAYGDEKQPEQQSFERRNIRFKLVTVFGIGK